VEKPVWMICVTHMFIEIYFLMQIALIPVLTREFQLGIVEVSLVVTVPSFVALLMNVPSGFLADRFSTNHLLFASMLIEGLSALLISQTRDFWMLVFGVSLMKIASPVYHISGLSQISRFVKLESMGKSIGFHNALGSLGSAAGVVSLAIFLSTLGWRWSYLFWALPILFWGLILLFSPQLKGEVKAKVGNKERGRLAKFSFVLSAPLLIFLFAIGVRQIGAQGVSTFMTTYLVSSRGLSESVASLIFGLGPFMGIVGSLSGGYLTEKTGAKKALSWAMLGCVISLSIFSFVAQVAFLILMYIVYMFFSNSLWSPMNTIVVAVTPESERGLSYSIYFLTEGLVASFAPTMAAGIIELSNVWFVFPFGILLMIVSLIAIRFLPNY
jgi:MFS family permease